MRFNKTKCRVLHLDYPQNQPRPGDEQIKSNPAQKDLRMLVDEGLHTPCSCSLHPSEESDLTRLVPSSINIFRQLLGSSLELSSHELQKPRPYCKRPGRVRNTLPGKNIKRRS